MKTIKLNPVMTEQEANELQGKFIDEHLVKTLVNEDLCVLREDGSLLAVMKKNIVPKEILEKSRIPYRKACKETNNRGMASGDMAQFYKVGDKIQGRTIAKIDGGRYTALLKDGSLSKTTYAMPVNSSLIGYSDRYPRIPYCRTTAYTQKYFKEYNECLPYISCVNTFFKEHAPHKYKIQKFIADNTSPDFVIKDTAFTTVTVNKNFRTAGHKDAGDLKEGFGNLGVISRGKYDGCYTVLPRYGVGLNIRDGDIALFDVHEVHGNTKVIPQGYYERISVVCYYREKMIYCGSKDYELSRAKSNTKKVALDEEIERANKIRKEIFDTV